MSSSDEEDIPKPKQALKALKTIDLIKLSETFQTIKQDAKNDSPLNLSPVTRSPLTMKLVSQSVISAFDVCEYPQEPIARKNSSG